MTRSQNSWDWLGNGIYFWEYAPYRAFNWAQNRFKDGVEAPAVIVATIRLNGCLNLLDTEHSSRLKLAYELMVETIGEGSIPRNTAAGAHYLDAQIVETYCGYFTSADSPFQSVRGCFPEGNPIFSGSKILERTHVQIAVRDQTCITKLRLVEFN